MAPDKDPQMERLNAQLRDHGCRPERDLWPGIHDAIGAEENRLFKQQSKRRPANWHQRIFWAAAALAAFVMVMVPFNHQPMENVGIAKNGYQKIETDVALVGSDRAVATALKDLEKAVRENPGNQNLSRLVRMVSSRHGELMRNKWVGNTSVRDILNGGVS